MHRRETLSRREQWLLFGLLLASAVVAVLIIIGVAVLAANLRGLA